ncbi:bacteriocin immunity protein [Pseudolactococcus insecticola]|uniref:Bacteriocin immunity protein n=1 Tax=Pseudolactococcus insecticola TaxID=2709158 RepID=A0A6A0BAC3_9LACT|nr:bacteriocin immunity protein [Lactococcus insecticola]GFH41324.1 hypothetical protein Hs20B_17220 [Lactococcus insecticola]
MSRKEKESRTEADLAQFKTLLAAAIAAPDVVGNVAIQDILQTHLRNVTKTGNIERELAQLTSDLGPLAIKQTLPHSTGELYLVLKQQKLSLTEIMRDSAMLYGLQVGIGRGI